MGRQVKSPKARIKAQLDKLYAIYNSPKWIHPDPLEYLYQYTGVKDREVVGLIASSLAYGRVLQIVKSISCVLEKMGPSPYDFLQSTPIHSLRSLYKDFRHRFTTGDELVALLAGLKRVMERNGSLFNCFTSCFKSEDETILPALSFLVRELGVRSGRPRNSLLPIPEKGSACKRLHLFLRWMVRKDRVDPGGWNTIPPAKLVVPLDTHMHRISLGLKLTERRHSDVKTALEVTRAFRELSPKDPVRYDFALTRVGIRKGALP
jgi:uncharacterized protein (TIGR02757 family)